MATNYERLVQCTKEELSYFFDSLVHKPASAYVDWDLWLNSEDPEAPYIGEEAFFLDGEEELKCRFLEEKEINGEKHRTFYCVLPKGEVRKETIPSHLVRLATEEEYPEEDPLRKLINQSVNEYTTEQDYSSYIFANPGTTIEKTASIPQPVIEEPQEEIVLTLEDEELSPIPESEEIVEIENEEPLIEEVIEIEEPIIEETIEPVIEEPAIEETAEIVVEDVMAIEADTLDEADMELEVVEPMLEENTEIAIEDSTIENTAEIAIEDPTIENTAEIVVEDVMAIDEEPLPSIEVSEAEEYTNKIEGLLDSLPTSEETSYDETIVLNDLSNLSSDETVLDDSISLETDISEDAVDETIVFDTISDVELPQPEEELEAYDETIVISSLDELKNFESNPVKVDEVSIEESVDTLEADSSFDKTDEYDLEKELANFENTLTELENVVNDPGSSLELTNSHAINTSSIIQEYEDETDVELHDLLDDIKSRSTLFDPENPEDRELPTIAFMAMNPHDEDE